MTMRSYEGTPAYLAGYQAASKEIGEKINAALYAMAKELGQLDDNGKTAKATMEKEGNPEAYGAFCALVTVMEALTDNMNKTALKYWPKGKEGEQ